MFVITLILLLDFNFNKTHYRNIETKHETCKMVYKKANKKNAVVLLFKDSCSWFVGLEFLVCCVCMRLIRNHMATAGDLG